MSRSLQDHFIYMAAANFIAYRAFKIGETPVACVLVNKENGKIVSFGCNNTNKSLNGTRHAEFESIDRILKLYDLQDAKPDLCREIFSKIVVYVTIEPCVMCALALKQIGVKEVYFGAANDRFGGNGTTIKVQDDSSYLSVGGIMRVEAIHLLRCFYIQENDSAPIPKLKKNKEIYGKEFPPNLNFPLYLNSDTFKKVYGVERHRLFYKNAECNLEITPNVGRGYNIEQVCDLKQLKQIPGLEELYQGSVDTIEEDLAELIDLLPAVNSDAQPYFPEVGELKKRKISETI